MPVTTRVQSIEKDISIIIAQDLSPEAMSAVFGEFAQEKITEADDINRRVLGRIPPRKVYVDGREGAPLASVRPSGVIVAEWELVADALFFIAEELKKVSPVRSGQYQASHTLFADGAEIEIGKEIPPASEYVFLSAVIYARKIEGFPGRKPQSPQAPKGVYEITALKAAGIYGNQAKIRFVWRKPINGALVGGKEGNKSDGRVPAIVVTLRS
jgi:hypothetical protein